MTDETQKNIRPWERLDTEKWEHVKPADHDPVPHYADKWECSVCQEDVRVKKIVGFLEALRFGTDGYNVKREMKTEFTLHCPDCGDLQPTTDEWSEASRMLKAHAAEQHSITLPEKPIDFRGNPIG